MRLIDRSAPRLTRALAAALLVGSVGCPGEAGSPTAPVSQPALATIEAGATAVEGRWESAFATPVVAVHMHLLRTGKVLLWGDQGDAYLWGSTTGFTPVTKPFRSTAPATPSSRTAASW